MKLLLSLAAIFSLCAPAFPQVPAKQRMVVVISLDGFPAYDLSDPKLPIPTLRTLMERGVSTRMSIINPTVTWPNHTTMVTGVRADEHGLLANGTITRTGGWPPVKVEPRGPKTKMVHVPTVYDAAFQAGLTTAQVDWVAINDAPTITWPVSEWASASSPVEREMIAKGVLRAGDFDDFTKANILYRDQVWTKSAAYLIREHKPNLLLFHLLSLDTVHHHYGPKTLAGTSAIAFLDSCVAQIVEAVRAAGMMDRTTFLVVSDHGFKAFTKQVRPAVALAQAGLSDKIFVMPEGGTAYVYFDHSKAAELLPKVKAALQGAEGIDQIIGPERFAGLGVPQPGVDPQAYEMLLAAKDGYSFSGATGGPVTAEVAQQGGSHGYLSTDPDMDAIFIASGYGVHAGKHLDHVANTSVAATIANLLGVKLPTAKGAAIPLE